MNAIIEARAAEIKAIVCRVLDADPEQVSDTDLFMEDLGADSLKLVEVLATLQIKLDVEVDPAEFRRLVNFDGVYEVLSEALEQPGRT